MTISIFLAETASDQDLTELEAITKPAPAPKPTAQETRAAIVAAAEAWEQGVPARLARITIARRICSVSSTDPKWNLVRKEIADLLDVAKVDA